MRISDWSSDVCSSDLDAHKALPMDVGEEPAFGVGVGGFRQRPLVELCEHRVEALAELPSGRQCFCRDDRLLRRVEGMEGGRSAEEAGRKSNGGGGGEWQGPGWRAEIGSAWVQEQRAVVV